MTLHFPDVSSYQAGISFKGAPIAMVKATEGTGYVSPDYAAAKARAASAGAYLCAYHFLRAGNGAAQAAWCYHHAGTTPLMLDMELEGSSKPGVADAAEFIHAYRALGGRCFLLYLPHWYWQSTGSPSLQPLTGLGMLLVSSQYTAYSDTGPGWNAYGGMTPVVWQYTDSATFNGHSVDFNAFKGTLPEFISLATTGKKAPVQPAPHPRYPVPAGLSQTVQPIEVHLGWQPGTPLSPHWRYQVVRWADGKPGDEVASDVVVSPNGVLRVPGPGQYAWRVQAAGDSPFTGWRVFTA
jgi:hypothetical protein